MPKKKESVQKRITKKMKAIEKKEKEAGSDMTHMRVSNDNLRLLEDIKDITEIDYELEMDALGIKKLSIDDALTRVLWEARGELHIQPEMLNEESRMIKLINYRGLA
jgi:hypothetical protein